MSISKKDADSPDRVSSSQTMRSEFKEAPIPLITQEGNKYTVHEEGLQFLRSIEAPIAVVGVAGLYRTGKSYLLNRIILNRKTGFGVGPTVNPCTKGIWIWGKPIPGTNNEGEKCNVVVLDSEGIGALDQDSDHDTRIFAMAVLISSYFIYNSVGSIDETALQNLSLVVNLTKHIHIKSQQHEVDSADYAMYFPSFLWVVRDFALKLVDSEGENITPKEYLEKALLPQKGFSDSVEDKNRIRRLLKEFFKDRDCCTLVRPTIREDQLQRLEEMEFEDLRLEFVEQVVQLRKKILGKLKVKNLNNKPLNGNMLATLVESYINAINKGAVPTIENAWTYICKTECNRALQEALNLYEVNIEEVLSNKFPLDEEELKNIHKEAKAASELIFEKKSIGEDKEAFKKELIEKLKFKYSGIKADNSLECQRRCVEFINENYQSIDQKLKNGDFKGFIEYEKELRAFVKYFDEHGPEGPQRREIILEFCQNKLSVTGEYFIKFISNEAETKDLITSQKLSQLEVEVRESKEDLIRERSDWQRRITVSESERTELAAKEQSLREQLMILKQEKEKVETDLRSTIKNARSENTQQLEQANSKVWEFEEKMKEMERSMLQQASEYKEEKALVEQKLKYLENNLEESRKREKEALNEFKSSKKDHSSSIKEIQSRFEAQIKTCNSRLDAELERVAELERQLEDKENIHDRDKSKWEEQEIRYKSMVDDYTQQVDSYKQKIERKDNDHKKKLTEITKDYENQITKLKKRVDELEKKLKDTEEVLKTSQAKWSKESAMVLQKLEFAEQELDETKRNLEEQKKQHSSMLSNLQSSSPGSSEDVEVMIQRLRSQYVEDMKKLELESENTKSKLTQQLEGLRQKYSDLELKYKLDQSDWTEKSRKFDEDLTSALEEKARVTEQLNEYTVNFTQKAQENEMKLKKRVQILESQLEDTKIRMNEELQAANSRAETSYKQLKEFYEQEKARMETRMADEKSRAEKKYSSICEEYEDKIRVDAENYEDEIMAKDDELREQEAYYSEEVSSLKHQAGLSSQKIETLEKYLKETKEQLETAQKNHSIYIEQLQERLNSEKTVLLEKIEKLANESSTKDRELTSLGYRKEQLESQLASKEAELEDFKEQYDKEKTVLNSRLETAKQNYQKINDEYTLKKNDFKREIALAQQEIEFKTKRVEDLEKSLQDSEERYNEALKSLKDQSGQELAETIAKLTQAKESLESKLEQKRRAMKELESSSAKQINSLEKERAVLAEKLSNMEAKKADIEHRLKLDIENLMQQLRDKKDIDNTDKMNIQLENERLKTLMQESEKELNEKTAAYDRERMLWENKFNFLMQQREQAKNDLTDAQKKFEIHLENVQKRLISEKEKLEGATNSLIASMEARYTGQIKDMQESHQVQVTELTERLRSTEKDLRNNREQLELERRGRNMDSGTLEKRVQDLIENEAKLIAEIEKVKKDRDRKIDEFQETFITEKEQLKSKLIEYEKRAKEAEHMRSQLFLENEKERAKWNSERDHLISKHNEDQDMLERLEKRKEALLRENEKLRNEKGSRRTPGANYIRRPEGAQGYKQAGTMLNTSGMSFEEYSKEGDTKNMSGRFTPTGSFGDVSPMPSGRRGVSPSIIHERNRSGGTFKFDKKPDS
ncbi:hypothetical protein SteCoe_3558 [Stentor coeruleus]|uniref:GB1/RHD3-type G domain-containing protein n=1 Tax=Stentor coeruleus TaxID=5963 RepID=A0A1R2CWR5_9CILI|nr:hypothetical protein SteCoe_3558 [Stentor coeruleus]